MPPTPQLIGIDVGGTFTDFVWLIDGELRVFKEPTTPADQSEAILRGLDALGVAKDAKVVHGTTVATNALLERRGARTALLTTKGFADVLAIGRQNRPHLYKLAQHRPPPLVPDELRLEIDERVDAAGQVLTPIREEDVLHALEYLKTKKIESIAIVFLFSFLNPHHEKLAASALEKFDGEIQISVSSELLPEYREYERTATTAINAYVQPLVARYLARLEAALGRRSIHVMQSNGGCIGLKMASNEAARLVLSGPAGGIVGAFEVAKKTHNTETPKIVTFDMGGTSTDVALCAGTLPRTAESKIADLPLRFPSADIHTVGAGGGSIARIDAGGVLRVGPESAGAQPGPVCYGRGGVQPTVTDANVVLGRLTPADSLELDVGAAKKTLEKLGHEMGRSAEEAALGVIQVANAAMERALRKVSIERGHDPREYELVPFGGAGPLHACELAEALGMSGVLVPRYPGVLSAMGLLMADASYETSQAMLCSASSLIKDSTPLASKLSNMKEQVLDVLGNEESLRLEARLDMRYAGQSYEIETPLVLPPSRSEIHTSVDRFHELHQQRFGYQTTSAEVEVVTVRLEGRISGAAPAWPRDLQVETPVSVALIDEVSVWLNDTVHSTPRYDREKLRCGHVFEGPAIVTQYDTTTWIPPSWMAKIDVFRNMELRRVGYAPQE